MRVVIQRVKQASVSVNQKIISKIEQGYLLLVGLKQGDNLDNVIYIARKIAKLRIFSDSDGKLNLGIKEINGKILSISQFTLYGDTTKSNRPGFSNAMNYQDANHFYKKFNQILKEEYGIEVLTGEFGKHMDVTLTNDGPVTIIIEK